MMEARVTENVISIIVRQRDVAMSKCAELEAKVIVLTEKLATYEKKQQPEHLFKEVNKDS